MYDKIYEYKNLTHPERAPQTLVPGHGGTD